MIKTMTAVWCNYTDTRCVQKVIGDNVRQALDYAIRNGWFISGAMHLCPYHKPKGKK